MLGNDVVANTYFERQLENYSSGSCIFETKRNYYYIRRTTIKPTFTCEVDDVKKIYGLIRELIMELEPISRGLCDKYIVDLVFQVKDKKGRDVLIDLSAVNYPTTLKENLETIKTKI